MSQLVNFKNISEQGSEEMLLFVVALALKKNWLPLVILTEVDRLVEWILLWRWFVSRKLFSLQAGKAEADKEKRREMIEAGLDIIKTSSLGGHMLALKSTSRRLYCLWCWSKCDLKNRTMRWHQLMQDGREECFFVWLDKTLRQKKRPWEHFFFQEWYWSTAWQYIPD